MQVESQKKNTIRRIVRITVIDRLIGKDLFKTLAAVLTVIVVIIVSRKFIKVLDKAIEGEISNETVLNILALKTIVASVAFLPAAMFMAILMVLGRMYRDQEMSAIFSAGGGAGIIYRAVFILALPLSIIASIASLYISPWAEASMEQLMHKDEQTSDIRGVSAGHFSEYSHGDLVFYVESIDSNNKMHKVFVQDRQHNALGIISAKSARMELLPTGRYVVLEQGERIQGEPGDLNYTIEDFSEYAVRLEEKGAEIRYDREAKPMSDLWQSTLIKDWAEIQNRFSIPLGLLCLSFLAVPLAQTAPRGGVYGNMAVAFLIYFCYGNLKRINHSWLVKETIPVWMGSVWVYVFILIIGVALLVRLYGKQWVQMKLKERLERWM